MRIILFNEQNGSWKCPWDRELFLGFQRLDCLPQQPAVPNPTSCLGFLQGGLHCPGSRSAQDMRPRTLGVSRMTNPGSSQAWMESSSHSTKLHYDPTDNTGGLPGPHLSVPLHTLGSLFVPWSPSSPIHGLRPTRFQNLLCSGLKTKAWTC